MSYLKLAETGLRNGMLERQILIGDVSGSMGEEDWKPSRLKAAIEASQAFLDVKYRLHPEDEVGIVGFSEQAKTIHPPIQVKKGRESLRSGSEQMKAQGGTNITAGLKVAESLLFPGEVITEPTPVEFLQRFSNWLFNFNETAPAKAPESRIPYLARALVLTDGGHNTGPSPLPVAQRLKDRGVVIDCIGIGGSPDCVDEAGLKAIASRNPDGSIRYCFIGDKSNLIQKYEQLANRIRPA